MTTTTHIEGLVAPMSRSARAHARSVPLGAGGSFAFAATYAAIGSQVELRR
jgi:hypothetical protein